MQAPVELPGARLADQSRDMAGKFACSCVARHEVRALIDGMGGDNFLQSMASHLGSGTEHDTVDLESAGHEDGAVTTDLSGDFELGEDEFEWDVFVPDPTRPRSPPRQRRSRTEDELDLDDSEFDWEAALREDSTGG